jgi:hypothetical protein
MKFHVVTVLTFYGNTDRIDAFHAEMFHGRADRGGESPTSKSARLAHDVDRPMRIHKNAFQIADVFAPEFQLVVSSLARGSLLDVPHLRFVPITFRTLFSCPYGAGDFSFWEDLPDYRIQQEFIDQQKNDPQLHSYVGDYFELVAPPVRDIRDRFEGLRSVSVDIASSEFDDPLELPLSAQLLEECPVFSCGSFEMSDAVFSRLEAYVDWTYFTHVEGSL